MSRAKPPSKHPQSVRLRGREYPVAEAFSVRGRNYLAVEKLSRRGAYKVFDKRAAPGGDFRVLHRLDKASVNRRRLETLRRIAGPTANRNFATLVECTPQAGDYFVVLSWVWGASVKDYLRQVRAGDVPRPSLSEVVRLCRGLAHGLGHYHRVANLVHGDVSPANLILTSGSKQLVLIDFGSAWPVEMTADGRDGDGVTRLYAAPELVAGAAAGDFRSDVFSLGVVAYELLSLEIPYDGLGGAVAENAGDIPYASADFAGGAATRTAPKRARELLDALLKTSLAVTPDRRFATRSEWLDAWDALHTACRGGGRLTQAEEYLASACGKVAALFRLDGSKPR